MADAAKSIGVIWTTVKKHINAKNHRTGLKGFIFKLCGDNSPIGLLVKKVKEPKGNPSSWRPIRNTITGEVFANVSMVAKKENLDVRYFWKQLNGQKPNPHPYCYV